MAKMDFKNLLQPGKKDHVVTSADFDSDSQTLLIGTYGQAYEILLKDINSFAQKAKIIPMPSMKQAEAITYLKQGSKISIFTASEGEFETLYKIACEAK
jgi:hypothetical protein